MIDRTVLGHEPFVDVKLVVFPEFAHAAPIYEAVAERAEKQAVPIPNELTDRYVKKAKEHGVCIQTGHSWRRTRAGLWQSSIPPV
jgi:hypothetical protein